MNISINESRFDELQLRLLKEIVTAIKGGLEEAGIVDDDTLFEATENLTFSLAAIIDGSREMELNGEKVAPILMFASKRADEALIAAPGSSWMHEYAFGMVEEVFDSEDESDIEAEG